MIRFASVLLLLTAAFSLQAAVRFQVAYLPGPAEPVVSKAIRLTAVSELLAKRLSQTLKTPVAAVPFEKADAETIFLVTREDALGGDYKKVLAGKFNDSFLIRYPVTFQGKKNVCLLMTRDSWGYCYPGNYFLRNFLGVDIVAPDESGLVIPDNSKWSMPDKIDIVQIPSFNTRRWTMNRVVDKELQRMYLAESGRNITWHALGHIVSPAKYGKTHPEYFPLVKGKRYIKTRRYFYDWAPCLSNPGVQKLCVEHLLKEEHKDGSDGASLAVNDGAGHDCECPGCLAMDDPEERKNGIYSTRFFRFYAKVLEQARKIKPGIMAKILLYSDATTVPPRGTDIHPGLIGMGVNDKHFEEFHKKGMTRIGKWEHQLDNRYPLIRHYPKWMAKNLRRLHKIGVTEYFGEVYMIHAANGPKQYILGRLLWDLNANPDAVMTEYCIKAFGAAAAPAVKAYYDLWETIHDRELAVTGGKVQSTGLFTYDAGKFIGLRPGDTGKMAEYLKQANAAPKTPEQQKRLDVVCTYFQYLRCICDRYLLALQLREKENPSMEEIHNTFLRSQELDKKFQQLWNDVISKDKTGLYRRVGSTKADSLFYVYREAISSYVLDSIDLALKNVEKNSCSGMKRSERLKFWQSAAQKYPDLLPVANRIAANSGKNLPNLLKNGNFKKYTPGNPAVKGAHPKLEGWFFYEENGDVKSNDYKSFWKLVPSKAGANHLGFGAGKYPEIRQYLLLKKGVYRFSLNILCVNMMNFAFYKLKDTEAVEMADITPLRTKGFEKPSVFNFNHYRHQSKTIEKTVVFKQDGWYALLIASPDQPEGTWNRIWNLKLEKLQ